MKRTPEQLKEFVLDTLLPYKEDPTTCGWNAEDEVCEYLTDEGKKCAVGKHMKEDCGYNDFMGSVADMVYELMYSELTLDDILTDEARGIPYRVWAEMQAWHDTLAKGKNPNNCLSTLAKAVGLPMDELMLTDEELENLKPTS